MRPLVFTAPGNTPIAFHWNAIAVVHHQGAGRPAKITTYAGKDYDVLQNYEEVMKEWEDAINAAGDAAPPDREPAGIPRIKPRA